MFVTRAEALRPWFSSCVLLCTWFCGSSVPINESDVWGNLVLQECSGGGDPWAKDD